MAYLIPCAGSKITPVNLNQSALINLSYNEILHDARLNLINQLNIDLDWNRTLPAWEIYSGNYSKIYPRVTALNWQKPNANIKILSALFGLINHTDLLPYYDLAMDEVKPNIGRISEYWRNLHLLPQLIVEDDVDLLSVVYRKAFNRQGNPICFTPNVNWRDRYGIHRGEWLNQQLNDL